MKASELRIGNWYQNKSVDIDLRYQQITFFEDAHYTATYCDAIPLTEEWLLKFGFIKETSPHSVSFHLPIGKSYQYIYFHPKSNEFGLVMFDEEEETENTAYNLKSPYVHSLQNLYFALTNEELIYTEKL